MPAAPSRRRSPVSSRRAGEFTPPSRQAGVRSPAGAGMDQKGEELAAVLAEIRQRVRARNLNGTVSGGIPLADLTPLLHARDAAEGKVASIGSVNPRPPGLVNSTIQRVKRLVARALDW